MDEAEKVVAEADSLPGLSAPQRKSMLENLHFHVGDIEEGTFGEEMEPLPEDYFDVLHYAYQDTEVPERLIACARENAIILQPVVQMNADTSDFDATLTVYQKKNGELERLSSLISVKLLVHEDEDEDEDPGSSSGSSVHQTPGRLKRMTVRQNSQNSPGSESPGGHSGLV